MLGIKISACDVFGYKMSQAFLYNEKQIKALNVETVKRNLDVPKIIYLISFPRNSTFGIVFLRISI